MVLLLAKFINRSISSRKLCDAVTTASEHRIDSKTSQRRIRRSNRQRQLWRSENVRSYKSEKNREFRTKRICGQGGKVIPKSEEEIRASILFLLMIDLKMI